MKKVEINVFNINEFIQFINKYNKFYNFNINTILKLINYNSYLMKIKYMVHKK